MKREDVSQIVEHVMEKADKRYRADGYRGIDGHINDQELRLVLEALLETIYDEIDRRLPAPRVDEGKVLGHSPVMTMDMRTITGCTCGWRTPPAVIDSDDAFAMHAAFVRATENPP